MLHLSKFNLPLGYEQFVTLASGNSTWSYAKVVVLENSKHYDLLHRQAITAFVNQYAHAGDLVLVEGHESLVSWNDHPFVKKNLTVVGWDNMKLHQQSKQLIIQHIVQQIPTFKDVNESFDQLTEGRDSSLEISVKAYLPEIKNCDKRMFVLIGKGHSSFLIRLIQQEYYIALSFREFSPLSIEMAKQYLVEDEHFVGNHKVSQLVKEEESSIENHSPLVPVIEKVIDDFQKSKYGTQLHSVQTSQDAEALFKGYTEDVVAKVQQDFIQQFFKNKKT